MVRNGSNRESADEEAYALDELVQQAAEGRRLAIYDRVTGLYAYWYLDLRAHEEVSRARRYDKPLSVISFWVGDPATIVPFAAYLNAHLRDHDLAGYLNNGHFVVMLPETSTEDADVPFRRALRVFPAVEGAMAVYPDDGASFEDLLGTAKRRASRDDAVRGA